MRYEIDRKHGAAPRQSDQRLRFLHRHPRQFEKLSLCRSVLMRAVVFDKPRGAVRVMRALAFTACVPYLALKIAWVSGSRVGIPDGSMLLEHRTAMIVGNSASVLLDSMVVVLALLLTQPWGRRVPVWLLILPAWAATGLLSPIMVGYPLQLCARLLGGTAAPSGGPAARPFLDEWVFTVVYTGFIVQALALGALFVLYARARWGHLWRGRISGLAEQGPTHGAQRATALMASAVLLVPLTTHLLWATGSTSGLTATKIAERTSDFYALEAAYVLFAVMTVTGLLLVAFPRAGALPLRLPLSLAFVGSAALACWGGYMMLTALENRDPSRRISELMNVTYSMQLLAGMLVFTMGAYFFAERAAQPGHDEESVARTPHSADARVGQRSSPSGPARVGHVSLSHPLKDSRPDSGSGVDHLWLPDGPVELMHATRQHLQV
jgi:hypothetical protein